MTCYYFQGSPDPTPDQDQTDPGDVTLGYRHLMTNVRYHLGQISAKFCHQQLFSFSWLLSRNPDKPGILERSETLASF
jgi:hypothetical protein